jgi:hypothetical protein
MTDMTFYDIVGKKYFSDLIIHCDCLSVVMIGKIIAESPLINNISHVTLRAILTMQIFYPPDCLTIGYLAKVALGR